jgi:dTDP-4-amino-4,6-dideoxygalactose transaminase
MTGSTYAIACVNATSALHMALITVGVSAGDEVIVPTVTFIAPINVVRYVNANPIFMDCDNYYNIDIEKTVDFLEKNTFFDKGVTINKHTGKKISAIIVVHIFGNAVDLEPLMDICQRRNIKVVEDAAQSLGTHYVQGELKNSFTGVIGDIGCYSFNGNKIITTGGGGMVVTNNSQYAEKAKYLTTQAKDDPVRFIHSEIGYNFRLPNVQAAIGVAQLEKLKKYITIKSSNYQHYKKLIDPIAGLHLAEVPPYASANYWFYALQIDKHAYGKNREEVMALLSQNGVESRPLWYLNHFQKPYRKYQSYMVEKALSLWERTLNIPCSVSLRNNQIEFIADILKK